jgi:hypothetical protein
MPLFQLVIGSSVCVLGKEYRCDQLVRDLHVVAFAPFSQNSKGRGFAGFAQEHLTHM